MSPQKSVSQILRGHLAKRSAAYKGNLVKMGCMEPPAAPAKMAAAILKARKQNPKKKGK